MLPPPPLLSNSYTSIGAGKLFEVPNAAGMVGERIGGGEIVLRAGVAKGVRIVENDGKTAPALVLDHKVAVIHFRPPPLPLRSAPSSWRSPSPTSSASWQDAT